MEGQREWGYLGASGGGYLGDHALEGLHDLGALRLLVVGEDTSHQHHCCQHDTEVQLKETETTSVRERKIETDRGREKEI